MKLFISADIEGVAGIAHWDETERGKDEWYAYFQKQMTYEVAAACEGALKAGVTDILVKDAHDTGRNIDPALLPRSVCINRGWSGNPYSMVAGLSSDFSALSFIGYHSPGGGDGNPLSHTYSTRVDEITINGTRASEFTMAGYVAAMLEVPIVFLSGDAALCEEARRLVPGITTVETSRGTGDASTSMHPQDAIDLIRTSMRRAMGADLSACLLPLPAHFSVQVRYLTHTKAYGMSFYPGATQPNEKTIAFESDDYNEVLRFFHFVL